MNQNFFENDFVKFEFIGNVVKGTFKKGKVNLEVAKSIVDERLNFTNQKAVPLMITDLGLKSIEREARDFLSSDRGIEGVLASALVTNSAFGKYLANFFINITVMRPKIPTRVFTSEEDALTWLQSFIEKEN